jgi:hypothetical protein
VFKKTLIALSVGAALGSVNANAVTFDFTPNAWTTEGAELVNNFVVPDITVTLEAEYSKDDVITFEFNADVTGAFKTTIDVTLPNSQTGTMTLGYVSASDSTVTYRVTELSSGDGSAVSTDGATFILTRNDSTSPNLVVGDQVRAAGGLTGTYSAKTGISGLALDGTPAAIVDTDDNADPKVTTDDKTQLVTFVTQYATVTADSKFDGTIDVDPADPTPSRTVFTTAGTTDEATISVTEKLATNNALTTGLTVTLAGDFSFIQDKSATTAGVNQAADVLYAELSGTRVQGTVNDAKTQATFAFTTDGSVSDYDIGMFFDNAPNTTAVTSTTNAATEMVRGTFTASVDASYAPVGEKFTSSTAPVATDYDTNAKTGDITSKAAGSVAAGEWKLNGASVTVYSMPINNPAVTNYLYVTNAGALPAEVSISATTNGTTISANDIITVGAKSITNITEKVEAALASAAGNRATVELTLNAPACNIVVSAAYKVGSDRLPLETSQTMNGKCNTTTE